MSAVYEWIRNLTAFFLFVSVLENLLPGKKYGKYMRLFAGMVLILLTISPLADRISLEEVLARSYEGLLIQGEAEELKEQLGDVEAGQLKRIFRQYEEAVGQDITGLAASFGIQPLDCRVRIEENENDTGFGSVRQITLTLPAGTEEGKKEALTEKIREYYGLEEQYVEIEIAGGERPVDFSSDSGRDPVYSGISGGQ